MSLEFRDQLRNTFVDRIRKNAHYSLNAYARDLKVSSGRLSDILNEKQGLSLASARKIAERLGLSASETKVFCVSVESSCARNKVRRAEASRELKKLATEERVDTFPVDEFHYIADWYHFAILELAKTKSFSPEPRKIAQRLGIGVTAARLAVARLKKLGLLRKKGESLECVRDVVVGLKNLPSAALRKHHSGLIERGLDSIERLPASERFLSSLTISAAPSLFPEIQKRIDRFRREINELADSSSDKEEVYACTVQFFPLSQKE